MTVQITKGFQRPSALGWIVCLLVILITFAGNPINATASVLIDQSVADAGHSMTKLQGEHDISASINPCYNPDCDRTASCEKSCSLGGG